MIYAGHPLSVLARAVTFDKKSRLAHPFYLDLEEIAVVDGAESFVLRAGGDDIPRLQPDEFG